MRGFRALRARVDGDAGFTLTEMLVAMVLCTTSVLAILGALTKGLEAHRDQRDTAAAQRVATQSVEQARNLPFSQLLSIVGAAAVPGTVTGANGKSYTTSTTVQSCSLGDRNGACTTPASGAPSDVHVKVNVTWQEGGATKSLAVVTGVTDDTTTVAANSGSQTLAGLTGAATSGLTVAVQNLTVNPTSVTVDASGHPVAPVVLTATIAGLSNATTFPVTWTDDSGSHQATMSGSSGMWTATIPAANIQRVLAVGTSSTVQFTAIVPGAQGVSTASMTVVPVAPPTLSCSVNPIAIVLTPLTTKTSLPTQLVCTSTGLGTADSVKAGWTGTTGTVTGSLATTNGSSWTLTLPAGTSLPASLAEKFSFTATRASDSSTVTATATATVA